MLRRWRGCEDEGATTTIWGHERCLSQEVADLDTDCAPSARLWQMVGSHSYANARGLRTQSVGSAGCLNLFALASIFLRRRRAGTDAMVGLPAGMELGGEF